MRALLPVWWTEISHEFWIDWTSFRIRPHAFWRRLVAIQWIQSPANCSNKWLNCIRWVWRTELEQPDCIITMHYKSHRMATSKLWHFLHRLSRGIISALRMHRWHNHYTMASHALFHKTNESVLRKWNRIPFFPFQVFCKFYFISDEYFAYKM